MLIFGITFHCIYIDIRPHTTAVLNKLTFFRHKRIRRTSNELHLCLPCKEGTSGNTDFCREKKKTLAKYTHAVDSDKELRCLFGGNLLKDPNFKTATKFCLSTILCTFFASFFSLRQLLCTSIIGILRNEQTLLLLNPAFKYPILCRCAGVEPWCMESIPKLIISILPTVARFATFAEFFWKQSHS